MNERKNKDGYTAIQSRTIGQQQYGENHLELKNVTGKTDGRTDERTDGRTDGHGKV